MSKSQTTLNDDLSQPPPPYSPSPHQTTNRSSSSTTEPPSLFAPQIASLHAQIISNNQVQTSIRDEQANRYLSAIIPHLETFLQQIATIHPVPRVVEAYLVPDDAVGKTWDLSDKGEKLRGEVRSIVRVSDKGLDAVAGSQGEKSGKAMETTTSVSESGGGSSSKGFNEWGWWDDDDRKDGSSSGGGSSTLWWNDERMARQVARALQATSRSDGNVSMRIASEEVTFRRENEMGLWESKSGWGIVARLRIRV